MKDPFSIFIEDSVYYTSNRYYKLMFETKKLFFESLIEKKSTTYFQEEVNKIWGKVDHSFMKQRIDELEKMIGEANSDGHKILNPDATFKEVFKLEPESRFIEVERLYEKTMNKYYSTRLKTLKEGYIDENSYLTELVKKYDDTQSIIPYYNKDGTIRSYHTVAGYNSMIYNVNMNRSGWNRSMYDAELLGNDLVYLPAHPFACPLCMVWQGQVYSISGKDKRYEPKEHAIEGGIGHPNCKHQWLLYWGEDQLQKDDYNSVEWLEKYNDKQKIQSLQLERTRLKNDKSIYEKIGNQEAIDKTSQKISKINAKIKEINSGSPKIPTKEITNKNIPKTKDFVPATTKNEAKQYASDLGIKKTYYDDMSLEVANEINKSLTYNLEKYPKLKDRINSLGSLQQRNKQELKNVSDYYLEKLKVSNPNIDIVRMRKYSEKYAKQDVLRKAGGEYAHSINYRNQVWNKFDGIYFNDKFGKDPEMFLKHIIQDIDIKFHPIGTGSIKAIMDHETGHQLDEFLGLNKDEVITKLWRSLSGEEVRDGLSAYATKNIKEFIAEGFSEYRNNPNPRNIALMIGKRIDEVYERGL